MYPLELNFEDKLFYLNFQIKNFSKKKESFSFQGVLFVFCFKLHNIVIFKDRASLIQTLLKEKKAEKSHLHEATSQNIKFEIKIKKVVENILNK